MHAQERRYVKRKDWLKARKSFICSTDTASIFGVGYEGTSAHTVWGDKTGLAETESKADPQRLKIGQLSEDVIRRMFEFVQKVKIKRPGYTLFIHPHIPWLAASIDGTCQEIEWVEEGKGVPRIAVVECKWVDNFQKDAWENGEVPLKFQVQVQHQMEVLGLNHGYVVGLSGAELLIRLVPRNQRFIDAMLAKLREFWACVQEKRQPAVDGSYATAQFLQRLHPDDNGKAVILPESLEMAYSTDEEDTTLKGIESGLDHLGLLEVERILKHCEKRAELLKNLFRAVLGPNTYGQLPRSLRCVSWKTQEQPEHVRKATKSRVLRKHDRLPKGVDQPTITASDPTTERIEDGSPSPRTIETTDPGPIAE
jgi:putative phage-type endonuclease